MFTFRVTGNAIAGDEQCKEEATHQPPTRERTLASKFSVTLHQAPVNTHPSPVDACVFVREDSESEW